MNFLQLPEDEVSVVGLLNPGERVLWEGTCASRMGRQRKAFPIVGPWRYLLLLIAMVVIGRGVGTATGSRLAGLLASVLVLAILGVCWGWILEHVRDSDMYCRKQTRYLITNRRAVVLRNCRTSRPLQSLPWVFVNDISAEWLQPDGRGTVQFLGWDAVAKRPTRPMRFLMVRNAAGVVEQARSVREAAQR